MKKLRIRTKYKNHITIAIVSIIIFLIFTTGLVVIQVYRDDKQAKELLLIASEQDTYAMRLEEVQAMNTIHDHTRNGYQKIIDKTKTSVLVISDTDINEKNRYQIKPKWQLNFETSFNTFSGQKSIFSNILLRGSNTLWAYMQVSSDLKKMDFDFGIIEISINDLVQLSEDEFIQYYEALLKQLFTQFIDMEVFVILNNDIIENNEYRVQYKQLSKMVNDINLDYKVFTIEVDNQSQISVEVDKILKSRLLEQKNNKISIVENHFDEKSNFTNGFLGIKSFTSSMTPSEVKGFRLKKGLLFNIDSNNYIEYELENQFAFLNYVTFPNGCIFEIYIDNVLYKTVDTYNPVTGVGVLAFPKETKSRKIKIIALNDSTKEDYLMMDKILLGK